jgi:hypothetical protein
MTDSPSASGRGFLAMRDRDSVRECCGHHKFSLTNGIQNCCWIPDLPGSSCNFHQGLQNGGLGSGIKRYFTGFGFEKCFERPLGGNFRGILRVFKLFQLCLVERAKVLFQPVGDFAVIKSPFSIDSRAGMIPRCTYFSTSRRSRPVS